MTKLINNCTHHTISIDGTITNTKTTQVKKQWLGANGYYYVDIHENGIAKKVAVHRLIAQHFLINPDAKRTVNHLDGNKLNNTLSNLEWATNSENTQHAYDTGLQPYRRNYSLKDYENFLHQVLTGTSITALSKIVNQSLTQLSLHIKEAAIRLGLLADYVNALKEQKSIQQRNANRVTVAVDMIDVTSGKVLMTFSKVKDAMRYLGKTSSGPISNALNGRQKSAFGYFWKRV